MTMHIFIVALADGRHCAVPAATKAKAYAIVTARMEPSARPLARKIHEVKPAQGEKFLHCMRRALAYAQRANDEREALVTA